MTVTSFDKIFAKTPWYRLWWNPETMWGRVRCVSVPFIYIGLIALACWLGYGVLNSNLWGPLFQGIAMAGPVTVPLLMQAWHWIRFGEGKWDW